MAPAVYGISMAPAVYGISMAPAVYGISMALANIYGISMALAVYGISVTQANIYGASMVQTNIYGIVHKPDDGTLQIWRKEDDGNLKPPPPPGILCYTMQIAMKEELEYHGYSQWQGYSYVGLPGVGFILGWEIIFSFGWPYM